MPAGYALEWLDALISVNLNPDKMGSEAVLPGESGKLYNYIIGEKNKVVSAIKSAVFNLNNKAAISCVVKNYHTTLVSMLDQVIERKSLYREDVISRSIFDTTIACIEEVLYMIENRFSGYLGMEERIPTTRFNAMKKKLLGNISRTVRRLRQHGYLFPTLDIIASELQQILNQSANKDAHTFREMYYARDISEEIQHLPLEKGTAPYTELDKVLISMNFNSRSYISDLTRRIGEHYSYVSLYPEQMELLLLDYKLFNQLHIRPGKIFLPQDASLNKQMDNWFSQEMFFLEKRLNHPVVPSMEKEPKTSSKTKDVDKLLSILSVDQMALVLRAADDLRIVKARSLNSVFKNIVPYLSTPNQENISYDSMRSKSYAAETRDKKIVIDTLRQMIQKINQY